MNFQFLAIFLVCICIPSIYADDESLQFNKTKEESSLSSKIQPILIQWQQAENQKEFAQINNIPTIDEKVKILAQIPPISQIENQDSDVYKDNKFDSTYWVFILVAVIFLAIIIIKKRKTLKTNPQKN